MMPPPPVVQIAQRCWFYAGAELRGPFETWFEALRGCEIYADCVLGGNDVTSFSSQKFRFLSNFWPVQIDFEGTLYMDVEHAYQAAKTSNPEARERIRCAPNPAAAKRLGREVPIRSDWESIKIDVMRELLVRKFHTEPMRLWLLQTGGVDLVEGNTWGDTFGGVCRGRGRNELGRLIMDIRKDMQEAR